MTSRQAKRTGDDELTDEDSSSNKRMKVDDTISIEDDDETRSITKTDESDERIKRRRGRIERVFKTYDLMRDSLVGMSREDMEWFVAGKIVDAIDAGSDLQRARDLIDGLQRRVSKLESQLTIATKHVKDLDFLHGKCMSSINMARLRNGQLLAHPHYVTRYAKFLIQILIIAVNNINYFQLQICRFAGLYNRKLNSKFQPQKI